MLKTVALYLCAVADGDFVVAAYQSIQSFQKPQENALGFVFEDFAVNERVVRAVRVFGLCLQNELPPLEALGQVVERLQGEVAEADEAHIRLDRIVLHKLLLRLNGRFVGDEVLERPRVFERALAEIVVDEQQLVLDVRHAEGRLQHAQAFVVAVEIAKYAVEDGATLTCASYGYSFLGDLCNKSDKSTLANLEYKVLEYYDYDNDHTACKLCNGELVTIEPNADITDITDVEEWFGYDFQLGFSSNDDFEEDTVKEISELMSGLKNKYNLYDEDFVFWEDAIFSITVL